MKVERPSGWGISLLPIGGEGWSDGEGALPRFQKKIISFWTYVLLFTDTTRMQGL